uniref:Inter-alpha-trypsin inhibitor heavy chain n=1 Tax=Anoplophora glabripennis TaxID=217634 RepID=V5G5K3_ANOGL
MDINSKVANNFATTLVTTKVRSRGIAAKETTFTVVLPETAFISEFIMEVGTKRYRAFVKETEEAKNIYDTAVASGRTAAHVSISARDSNKFTVSLNVEPHLRVMFLLTYEEYLQRKNGQYELVLNIHPGQVVQNLRVKVTIKENRPLRFVKTPSIRSGNEIGKEEDRLNPSADIRLLNSTMAVVTFNPNSEKQKQFARYLGTKQTNGLSGQFVVQYDVERDSAGGEIFLQDGYFIHFFAPTDLLPLSKHVVFVLDTSTSMRGKKLNQLKNAMKGILKQIRNGDKVTIIEFETNVKVWNVFSRTATIIDRNINYSDPFYKLSRQNLPLPKEFNGYVLKKTQKVVDAMVARGATNIIAALETALYVIKADQERSAMDNNKKHQPIMVFLTDGEPNGGISSTDKIIEVVTQLNSQNNKVPIYSLSFGNGAKKDFLRKLSLKNQGFWKHIYEASDASLQLQNFYKEISSPLLTSVKFEYESEVKEVTVTEFPIYFNGSELVVAGKYEDLYFPPTVRCVGPGGPTTLRPTILGRPITQLERLWAYLTVKQLLDRINSAGNNTELTKRVVDLAQKYTFVTDVTSLVVVKPSGNSVVEIESASVAPVTFLSRFGFGSVNDDETENEIGPETEAPSLLSVLPWLGSVLQTNETITVGPNAYELGNNYNTNTEVECPKTPVNTTEPGICVLLKDCSEVYKDLKNFQTYQSYFCPVDTKYAGICCPKE